jgi:phage repressor protein C with HTH and peptisase S24 domain
MKDNSMLPLIPQGASLEVDTSIKTEDGDIVLVMFNGEYLIKRVFHLKKFEEPA